MKLLMVTHYFESHRGGIEIVAGRLTREWAKLGHSVAWLATGAPPRPAEAGIATIGLAAANFAERRLGFPYPVPSAGAIAAIFREAQRVDAVIMHDALYLTSLAAYVAARKYGKPILLIQHIAAIPYKNVVLRYLMRLASRLIVRPILARADQCVFISETVANAFSGISFHAPPVLIFNGVDTEIFFPNSAEQRRECRAALGLPQEKPIVLFAGRFVEKKGLPVLEQLARRSELTFAFAGWGPCNPRAWSLPNVCVYENLGGKNLAELYRASDVFVLPSFGEGYPLVIQEALACGLPVICSTEAAMADAEAAPYLIGIKVDPDDMEATAALFFDALMKTLGKEQSQKDRGMRAGFAAKRYSWESAAKQYMHLIGKLTGRKSSMGAMQ